MRNNSRDNQRAVQQWVGTDKASWCARFAGNRWSLALPLNPVFDAPSGVTQVSKGHIGVVGNAVGTLLVSGAVIFLLQFTTHAEEIIRAARETQSHSPHFVASWRLELHDFLLTREMFLLTHIWLAWVLILRWRSWREAHALTRVLAILGTIVVTAAHIEGARLAQQGVAVGVW